MKHMALSKTSQNKDWETVTQIEIIFSASKHKSKQVLIPLSPKRAALQKKEFSEKHKGIMFQTLLELKHIHHQSTEHCTDMENCYLHRIL